MVAGKIESLMQGIIKRLKMFWESSINTRINPMSDLSLVPTPELVIELQNRFDQFAIVGRKTVNAKGEYIDIRRSNGNRMLVVGLMQVFSTMLVNEELVNTVPISKDDDR